MLEKIKAKWDYIQFLLDIDGDVWMGLFTTTILIRLLLVLSGHIPLTNAEACCYASAVTAFAYSNKK